MNEPLEFDVWKNMCELAVCHEEMHRDFANHCLMILAKRELDNEQSV